MNICYEKYFKLSKDEYSIIKNFIDDNIDTFESILAPIHDSIDLYRKCYNNYCYCLKHYSEYVCDNGKYKEFCKENNFILKSIAKSYFNVEYIRFFYLLDFLYGFIYECANLINNLYDYDNYDSLVIKLCSEFVMPIINITKKEHIKEYNEHIKDTISALEHNKDIFSICSYLMNICCERYFKLSRDKYLEIKKIYR